MDKEFRPIDLYVMEVTTIKQALSSPSPIYGYWVSATWISNAKKYYDTLTLPVDNKKGKTGKKAKAMKRIRQRRGSESLPPWPDMNADITCDHGNLALTKGIRAKRKLIDKKSWQILNKYYPFSNKFKSRTCIDCPQCSGEANEEKERLLQRRQETIKSRRMYLTEDLHALAKRSNGVPSQSLSIRDEDMINAINAAIAIEENESGVNNNNRILRPQPLLPGIYHIMPRWWLKSWRSFIKDPEVTQLPNLDLTCLLCNAHGLLLAPPHIEEFLRGFRKNVFGGLSASEYEGVVYEIVSTEEWESLTSMYTREHAANWPDFSVRFSCDGEEFQWSQPVCQQCNAFADTNQHCLIPRRRGNSDLN